MKKLVLPILIFHLFSYIYAQNTKVMQTKNTELKISLKTENSAWVKDEKMIVTVEISNDSTAEITLKSVRFHLSPINGGFIRTFIVPSNKENDKNSIIKIKRGETISQTFDLAKLPFAEFESTDSGRKFGEIPDGKYRLTAMLNSYEEFNSSVLIDFTHC